MHEASIAQYIINELLQRVDDGTLPAAPNVVHLKIGKLSTVVPDNLRFMYDVLTKQTKLHDSALVIEQISIVGSCKACGQTSLMDDFHFQCHACHSNEIVLISGQELQIAQVECPDEIETI